MDYFDFFILNLHFIPFLISLATGVILLIFSALSFMARKDTFSILPWDVFNFNATEKKMFVCGAIAAFVGILGLIIVDSQYGYKVKYTDSEGNTTVINKRQNKNYEFIDNQ